MADNTTRDCGHPQSGASKTRRRLQDLAWEEETVACTVCTDLPELPLDQWTEWSSCVRGKTARTRLEATGTGVKTVEENEDCGEIQNCHI